MGPFHLCRHGADQRDLDRLTALYPDIPESLVELLKLVDGTYYREYPADKVLLYFLGSDYEGYPYYLLSARQMVETRHQAKEFFDYFVTREYDDIPVDEGVCDDLDKLDWLHFSDCCNNGGTSQLFIDFSPSAKGKKGQVLRFLHDPDEMVVVADSFDGSVLPEGFADAIIRERRSAKKDVQARGFYEWNQGPDWEQVVDLDTDVLVRYEEKQTRLFLQPIAENCLNHGMKHKKSIHINVRGCHGMIMWSSLSLITAAA